MKKIISLLVIVTFILTSCEGDRGPQGPPGPPGDPGDGLLGYTFERTVNLEYLSEAEYYSAIIDISDDIATVEPEADAVLVYRLEILQDDNGDDFDTWSLIPQNFFLDEGTIQYVYNHTPADVEIILEGNFDITNLNSGFTDNQTFRIIVVPSDFAQTTGIDVSNMQAVMNALNIERKDVKKASARNK